MNRRMTFRETIGCIIVGVLVMQVIVPAVVLLRGTVFRKFGK